MSYCRELDIMIDSMLCLVSFRNWHYVKWELTAQCVMVIFCSKYLQVKLILETNSINGQCFF